MTERTVEIMCSAIIAHLPQELLKDAVWHLERASKFEGEQDPFPHWREIRATVLFALTAVEAFMNMVASDHVQGHPNCNPVILDFLMEQESYVHKGEVKTRRKNLNLQTKISEWTKIITGKAFVKSDSVWQTFLEVKDFRNALVHYRPESSDVYNKADLTMAKKAIQSAKSIIQRYYECAEQTVPGWLKDIIIE